MLCTVTWKSKSFMESINSSEKPSKSDDEDEDDDDKIECSVSSKWQFSTCCCFLVLFWLGTSLETLNKKKDTQ